MNATDIQIAPELGAPVVELTTESAAISDAATLPNLEKVDLDEVDQRLPDVVTQSAKTDEVSATSEGEAVPAGDKEAVTAEVVPPVVQSTPANDETATPAVEAASDKTEEQAAPDAEPVKTETEGQDPPAADAEPAKEKTEEQAPPVGETVKDDAVDAAPAPSAEAEPDKEKTEEHPVAEEPPAADKGQPEGQTPTQAEESSSVDEVKEAGEQ
jgi:hypothetical protein